MRNRETLLIKNYADVIHKRNLITLTEHYTNIAFRYKLSLICSTVLL